MNWNRVVPELDISDFEVSLDFYTRLLGFEVMYTRRNFAKLELDGVQFMIDLPKSDGSGWNTGKLEKPYGRGVNFEIGVTQIDPIVERLKVAGVELFREPMESWYKTGDNYTGQREFLVQDPDGYLLRFCEDLGIRSLPLT